jgi:L-2-hydroxyglutarate oxidase LhgO
MLINAAGLWAPEVAASLAGFPAGRIPASFHAKGNYYALAGRSPFSRLVYPLPETGGLGVHLTLDLGGQARFGPDVEWLPSQRRGGHRSTRLPRRPGARQGLLRRDPPLLARAA